MLDAGCAALHEAEAVCTTLLADGATLALIKSVLMITWIHILYLLLILYSLYVSAGTYLSGTVWAQILTILQAGCSALTDRLFSTIVLCIRDFY